MRKLNFKIPNVPKTPTLLREKVVLPEKYETVYKNNIREVLGRWEKQKIEKKGKTLKLKNLFRKKIRLVIADTLKERPAVEPEEIQVSMNFWGQKMAEDGVATAKLKTMNLSQVFREYDNSFTKRLDRMIENSVSNFSENAEKFLKIFGTAEKKEALTRKPTMILLNHPHVTNPVLANHFFYKFLRIDPSNMNIVFGPKLLAAKKPLYDEEKFVHAISNTLLCLPSTDNADMDGVEAFGEKMNRRYGMKVMRLLRGQIPQIITIAPSGTRDKRENGKLNLVPLAERTKNALNSMLAEDCNVVLMGFNYDSEFSSKDIARTLAGDSIGNFLGLKKKDVHVNFEFLEGAEARAFTPDQLMEKIAQLVTDKDGNQVGVYKAAVE